MDRPLYYEDKKHPCDFCHRGVFMNLFEGFYLICVLRPVYPATFQCEFNTQEVFLRPQLLYCIDKKISMHKYHKLC